jgi:hypothetical protein
MKPNPPRVEKDFDRDMAKFEQQPARTKTLELLEDQVEKTTGPESLLLNPVSPTVRNPKPTRSKRQTGPGKKHS